MNHKVSPTTLNLLRECPRCFWLAMRQRFWRPRTPFPSFPSAIESQVKAAFKRAEVAGDLPLALRGCVEGHLVAVTSLSYNDPETGLTLTGRLDGHCLMSSGGYYAPLDHKLRSGPADGVHPAYQVQLDAYSFLLERNNRPASGWGYLLYWLPEAAGPTSFNLDLHVVKVETSTDRVLEMLRGAREVINLSEPPEPTCECEWCLYRTKGY